MSRILILSSDVIGKTMAGPGIRYWEFAAALSKHHEVTLAAPNEPDITSEGFVIRSYSKQRVASFASDYDVVITQSISPALAYLAKKNGVRLLLDAYDPVLLEGLEVFRNFPLKRQLLKNNHFLVELRVSLLMADAIICASEKQRDLWLGALMAIGRVTPTVYLNDTSLRDLIDVVPFGVQDTAPKQTGPGFREKLGIEPTDKVLLWGGGIWNWFDPLTLIKAIAKIGETRPDIKLVFLGLKHPNEHVLEMEMAVKAVDLAKELGLYEKTVFFNYGWVPYDERQNHFLEADLGVSTHFDHLETRFSFRTRILDYFWAQLPIVATKGDSMADLIASRNLGRLVDYEDVDGLMEAILDILDHPSEISHIKANLRTIADEFKWSRITSPINRMIKTMGPAPKRRLSNKERVAITHLYRNTLQDIREDKGVFAIITNVVTKVYKVAARRT